MPIVFTTGGPTLGVPTGRTMFGHSEVGLNGDTDDDDDFFECFLDDDKDIFLNNDTDTYTNTDY